MASPAMLHAAYSFAVREWKALGIDSTPTDVELSRLTNLVGRYVAREYPRATLSDRQAAVRYGVASAVRDLTKEGGGGLFGTIGGVVVEAPGVVTGAATSIEHAGTTAAGVVQRTVSHAAETVEHAATGIARDVERGVVRGARAIESGAAATLRLLERAAAGTLAAILRAVDLPSAALPTRVPINSTAAFSTLSRTLGTTVPGRLVAANRARAALRNVTR